MSLCLSSTLRAGSFDGDADGNAAFGQRFLPDIIPIVGNTANLPMPIEDDIHGPGMFDDLGFAVDLNVVRAVKLVPVNQEGDPRIASYVLDLVGRITRSDDHLPFAIDHRRNQGHL